MKVFTCLLNAACLFTTLSLAGCVITFEETATIAEIEIENPPPPAPTEAAVRPDRPSRQHVWVRGHHIVTSGTWIWVPGHWAKPPHRGQTWMPCHTRRKSEIWVWTPGYWF